RLAIGGGLMQRSPRIPRSSSCSSRRLAAPLLLTLSLAPACAKDSETPRAPTKGTLGESLYGVICDRVGAQALPEDLEGASFRAICHRGGDGTFADDVNRAALATAGLSPKDARGVPIPEAARTARRSHAIARIEALGRNRTALIA